MTYRELAKLIDELPKELLGSNVVAYDGAMEVYIPVEQFMVLTESLDVIAQPALVYNVEDMEISEPCSDSVN